MLAGCFIILGIFHALAWQPSFVAADEKWIVVIDATSSNTETFIYKFQNSGQLSLVENHVHVEAGMVVQFRSPADDDKIKAFIGRIFQTVNSKIDAAVRGNTPLYLLIPPDSRYHIEGNERLKLKVYLKKVLEEQGYSVAEDAVMPLSPTQKSQAIWIALNYLTNSLGDDASPSQFIRIGSLDMQVGFDLKDVNELSKLGVRESTNILGKDRWFYSKDYANYGINFALMRTVKAFIACTRNNPKCKTNTFESACLHKDFHANITIAKYTFAIKGKKHTSKYKRYYQCQAETDLIISDTMESRIFEIPKSIAESYTIYGLSYFFDMGSNNTGRYIKKEGDEVQLSVDQVAKEAKAVCKALKGKYDDESKSYACFQLCYLRSIMKDGFDFGKNAKIKLRKSFTVGSQNIEAVWPLGFSIAQMS